MEDVFVDFEVLNATQGFRTSEITRILNPLTSCVLRL